MTLSDNQSLRTEEEARRFLTDRMNVSRETMGRVEQFNAMLLEEMQRQNLIAPSTLEHLWLRHIADSAQLLLHCDAERSDGLWIDIGSGAGFPGLIIALLTRRPIWLVEPRRLRAEFLMRCVEQLGLGETVQVHQAKIERLSPRPADIITARAVASLDKLIAIAEPFSTPGTRWLLPKGRNAAKEYKIARSAWTIFFTQKPSLTDSESTILVGTVKGRRK